MTDQISVKKKISFIVLIILFAGFLIPQNFSNPVEGATSRDYNQKSFWFYPWGKSGTHKGVDIFAKEGTRVKSSTAGIVLYTGEIKMGGNVVVILGPKWRIHYYAHLKSIDTSSFTWASQDENIGTVGTTGNAVGKSPHLHYSIVTLIPYVWQIDGGHQGWKKMFYINPIPYLSESK